MPAKPKRDMDEPVNIDLPPEDALKVLLRAIDDPEFPPVGETPTETTDDEA